MGRVWYGAESMMDKVMDGMVANEVESGPVMAKVTVTISPILSAPSVCLATMYRTPSWEAGESTIELRSVLIVTSAELKVGVTVMLLMGMQSIPAITIGMVEPPLGSE